MSEERSDISPLKQTQGAPLTFRKRERLHHRNAVTRLFEEGKSEYAYPLRMFWLILTREQVRAMFHGSVPADLDPLQMMITVPKKKFKHAVDRVWLRRRIREAYRLNRLPLRDKVHAANRGDDGADRFMQLAFIYVGAEKREYASIEKKMMKLLTKAASVLDSEERQNHEEKDEKPASIQAPAAGKTPQNDTDA